MRDQQLRDFLPTEGFFLSALGTISARNAAFDWTITGDEKTAEAAHEMLNDANFGGGWEEFITQTSIDLYSADTGAFVELVREGDTPESPVIGINHLDSLRCWPTGVAESPVIYEDREGRFHQMKWFQVVQLLEMPAPLTPASASFFWKLQYSTLTRVLRGADILKSITTYKAEKVSGRFRQGIILMQGVSTDEVTAAIQQADQLADAAGLQRYARPIMVAGPSPTAEVSAEVIDFASLPDNFDEGDTIEQYVTLLAMGFQTDYQDFAPLPGGGLGTSNQSEILHRKSRGKGAGLFKGLITRLMNLRGVLPSTVEFQYKEADVEAEKVDAEVAKIRAETAKIRIESGQTTEEVERQIALDAGDLTLEDGGGRQDASRDHRG